MIVVDASAMVEALVGADADPRLVDLLGGELAAPHLLDVEVISVLRGLERSGTLSPEAADLARGDYFSFVIARHETPPLSERIWALRHQFTSYVATYLALAQALDVTVLTCDVTLAAPGHHATVLVNAPALSGRSRTARAGRAISTSPRAERSRAVIGHAWCRRRPGRPDRMLGPVVRAA